MAMEKAICEADVVEGSKGDSAGGFRATITPGNISVLTSMQRQWESLVQRAPRNEPFLHPRWFQAYAYAFEPQTEITVISVHERAMLRGIIPLVKKTTCFGLIPARTLRSLSGKHSCRFDCIVSKHRRPATIAAAWQALRSEKSWDVLEALDVPQGGAFEELTVRAAADGYFVAKWPTLLSPYLTIPLHNDDPYAHCPQYYRKVRTRLRNSLSRLASKGKIIFEATTTDYAEALRRFIQIEMSGWKGTRGSAIGCSDHTTLFYNYVMREFSKTGELRIYTMWLDQTAVAMELGLVMDGTYFSPKATYDERFASFSPGHLLTRHIISDLAHHRISRYDFLGPQARHKALWAGEVLPHAHYRIFRPTFLGRVRHLVIGDIAPLIRRAKRKVLGDPQQGAVDNTQD